MTEEDIVSDDLTSRLQGEFVPYPHFLVVLNPTLAFKVFSIPSERSTDATIAVFEPGRGLGTKLFRTAPKISLSF